MLINNKTLHIMACFVNWTVVFAIVVVHLSTLVCCHDNDVYASHLGTKESFHELDCSIKNMAWQYANKILPWCNHNQCVDVFDALQLQTMCNQSRPTNTLAYKEEKKMKSRVRLPSKKFAIQLYVDANNGVDNVDNTNIILDKIHSHNQYNNRKYPFKTIQYALNVMREISTIVEDDINNNFNNNTAHNNNKRYNLQKYVILREGYYYLKNTITLTSLDSNIRIVGHHNERIVLSAGYPLSDLIWTKFSDNILVADVSHIPSSILSGFNGFFVDGNRMIRARYPNANPEIEGLWTSNTGYISKAKQWIPPVVNQNAIEIDITQPNKGGQLYTHFSIGHGGAANVFSPPQSYWSLKNPAGGGAQTYAVPGGLIWEKSTFSNKTWANPTTGIVHAFHGGHWGNWQFIIDNVDYQKNSISWKQGGFQEARGFPYGAEYYVENIFEELDSPGEWFLDVNAKQLYFYPNNTNGASMNLSTAVATNLEVILRIEGNQRDSVQNVLISGLTFEHSSSTFLRSYEVPSGGDWSIHRSAALFIEGSENVEISDCFFNAPGGNAIFISNYNRNTLITRNNFLYSGDSAIASVGSTALVDGTNGNQPRGNIISHNMAHELGIWGKQTAFYFQATTASSVIEYNVAFNGPRAGINFNDHFGGDNLVHGNLVFNMVRETADHGCFNSWDRQPFLTNVNNKGLSLTPATSTLLQNFFINNYNSVWPIDHDDGSQQYIDSKNFLIYGGYKNYLGHSQTVVNNVYVFPDHRPDQVTQFGARPYCANSNGQSAITGWDETWANNTCILDKGIVYDWQNCNISNVQLPPVPATNYNTFMMPNGVPAIVNCQSTNYTLATWSAQTSFDTSSTTTSLPTINEIINMGWQLLGFSPPEN